MGLSGERTAASLTSDFAGMIDIGGRALYIETQGTGAPTVVLESGAGNNAQVWDPVALPADMRAEAVFPSVGHFTHVIAYDRPNTFLDAEHPSRSDSVPNPRTAAAMVADLKALLVAASESGPYVLVGHSFGGLVVRLFAATYPHDVAGLVLVDAAHEDWWATLDGLLSPNQRAQVTEASASIPGLEQIDTTASALEMKRAVATSPLPSMPLVALTHGQPWDWPAGFPVDAIETAWRTLQDELAALAPDGRVEVATASGHFIQLDEPALVRTAIQQVVETVRDSSG